MSSSDVTKAPATGADRGLEMVCPLATRQPLPSQPKAQAPNQCLAHYGVRAARPAVLRAWTQAHVRKGPAMSTDNLDASGSTGDGEYD